MKAPAGQAPRAARYPNLFGGKLKFTFKRRRTATLVACQDDIEGAHLLDKAPARHGHSDAALQP